MSFFAIAILPKDTETYEVDRKLASLMEAANGPAGKAVLPCVCLGLDAYVAAVRDDARATEPFYPDRARDALTRAKADPKWNSPVSDCRFCRGTGQSERSLAKWDVYQIGGRWNGIVRHGHTTVPQSLLGRLSDNIAPASLFLGALRAHYDAWISNGRAFAPSTFATTFPFALVDSGSWHARGYHTRAFLVTQMDTDEWFRFVLDRLVAADQSLVVGLHVEGTIPLVEPVLFEDAP